MVKVACLQFCSGLTAEENLPRLTALIEQAVDGGAEWIVTPENSNVMFSNMDVMRSRLCQESDDISVAAFCALAKKHAIWLQAGSFIVLNEDDHPVNRSMLFAPNGAIVARYDKIHLFDTALDNGETYQESASYMGGKRGVVVQLPFGCVGMSICYDVRFAGLYRQLAEAGAHFLTVAAAFTVPTGEAHWHILLRARAVETGCYVLAAAQTGHHESGRKTYGHSLIVDPWGRIIAELAEGEGVLHAQLDSAVLDQTRRQLPVLQHGKEFSIEVIDDSL